MERAPGAQKACVLVKGVARVLSLVGRGECSVFRLEQEAEEVDELIC